MSRQLNVTIGQLNPTVGDLAGNYRRAAAAAEQAAADGSQLLVLPEMFISGYPLQDLVMHQAFVRECMRCVERLAEEFGKSMVTIAVGGPLLEDGRVYNAVHVLAAGAVKAVVRKQHLPNYGVFDERRNFQTGGAAGPVAVNDVRVGFAICEDFWRPDVAETLLETGAELLVVVNGSPYETDKYDERVQHMVARTVETQLPVLYANLVGGQDDQVYDGGSFVLNRGGELAVQAPFFTESIITTNWQEAENGWRCEAGPRHSVGDRNAHDYRCLVLALADFVRKNGFESVLVGLSGGIDSALVATIAADALGPERVRAVLLPSEYTSELSLRCAQEVVNALGCRSDEVAIAPGVTSVMASLPANAGGDSAGVVAENLQARMRGLLLMAMANQSGELLLTTGNKSEVAVGYATLYGDMCGGYACITDVYKTRVYELCRWRNANHTEWMCAPSGTVVPEMIITREPTAELRPDQLDRDSLPPYEELDPMLEMLIEGDKSIAEVAAAGYDRAVVERVARLVRGAEFKRRQAAPGAKITRRAFWLERRYPITNRFTDQVQ